MALPLSPPQPPPNGGAAALRRRLASGVGVLVLALVALLTVGWKAPRPRATVAPKTKPAAKRRYVVAAMGDSLTDPRSHGGKYLQWLQKSCPQSRFDSYGVGGQMVNQMRKRLSRDVLGKPADKDHPKPRYSHLLVLGGINDICSDRTAHRSNSKIMRDLSAMYRAAREHGIRVVALTLPPWGGFTRFYNRRRAASTFALNRWILAQQGAGKVDAVLDVFPLLSCGDRELLCPEYGWPDKVHWSKAGHEVVGKALHAQVFANCR